MLLYLIFALLGYTILGRIPLVSIDGKLQKALMNPRFFLSLIGLLVSIGSYIILMDLINPKFNLDIAFSIFLFFYSAGQKIKERMEKTPISIGQPITVFNEKDKYDNIGFIIIGFIGFFVLLIALVSFFTQ